MGDSDMDLRNVLRFIENRNSKNFHETNTLPFRNVKYRRKLKLSSFQIFAVTVKVELCFSVAWKVWKVYITHSTPEPEVYTIVGKKTRKKKVDSPGATFLGFVRAFKWWRFACFFFCFVGGTKTCYFSVTIEVYILHF